MDNYEHMRRKHTYCAFACVHTVVHNMYERKITYMYVYVVVKTNIYFERINKQPSTRVALVFIVIVYEKTFALFS